MLTQSSSAKASPQFLIRNSFPHMFLLIHWSIDFTGPAHIWYLLIFLGIIQISFKRCKGKVQSEGQGSSAAKWMPRYLVPFMGARVTASLQCIRHLFKKHKVLLMLQFQHRPKAWFFFWSLFDGLGHLGVVKILQSSPRLRIFLHNYRQDRMVISA